MSPHLGHRHLAPRLACSSHDVRLQISIDLGLAQKMVWPTATSTAFWKVGMQTDFAREAGKQVFPPFLQMMADET